MPRHLPVFAYRRYRPSRPKTGWLPVPACAHNVRRGPPPTLQPCTPTATLGAAEPSCRKVDALAQACHNRVRPASRLPIILNVVSESLYRHNQQLKCNLYKVAAKHMLRRPQLLCTASPTREQWQVKQKTETDLCQRGL